MINLNQRPPTAGLPGPTGGSPGDNPPDILKPGPNHDDLKRLLHWLLSGNPFFLISAATMLYGLHLVAVDPALILEELSKLWFNVSSLEIYELMIVGAALLLARRRICYDCNLLVTLENLFMFVPFILISQATLFDDGDMPAEVQPMIANASIWAVCAIACFFAFVKLMGQRQIAILRIPAGTVVFGLALIAANVFFPLYFRGGIAKDAGSWSEISTQLWLLGLPLAVVAAGLIPGLRAPDQPALSRRNWPLVIPLLWVVATAVHLRTIDYLDDVAFGLWQAAPLAWAIAWLAFLRTGDFTKAPSTRLKTALLVAPLVLALAGARSEDANLFLVLMAANFAMYLAFGLTNHFRRVAFHLATVAFIAILAALPESLLNLMIPEFSREKIVLLCNGGYLTLLLAWLRRPGSSLFASGLFGVGVGRYLQYLDYLELYALQAALLFLLIHSLSWRPKTPHARPVRAAAAIALVAHSFIWGNIVNFRVTDIHVGLTIILAGALLIAAWVIVGRLRGVWDSRLLPFTGGLMIATVPLNYAIDFFKVAPKGHLTVLVSFVLFAVGVAYALNRHRWMGEGGTNAAGGGRPPPPPREAARAPPPKRPGGPGM